MSSELFTLIFGAGTEFFFFCKTSKNILFIDERMLLKWILKEFVFLINVRICNLSFTYWTPVATNYENTSDDNRHWFPVWSIESVGLYFMSCLRFKISCLNRSFTHVVLYGITRSVSCSRDVAKL